MMITYISCVFEVQGFNCTIYCTEYSIEYLLKIGIALTLPDYNNNNNSQGDFTQVQ